ncbi:UspA domain protein [Chthoniobacter flavus Ellin428]|uniref:UspA domain protein n=1 Tax=Chthoniobacter flavus Ellin428 TaxID=497964 RepID=B4CZJ2_9BACT|nr:STAS/SEC14 domain-containing protein [Chthoniobacter flavus]EDY20156.1 UspA domain protein [Chthoniobacter flavus Ellin428]TCO94054.1 SpoIIAA-like protein [Chthoniobacter flavus]
MKTTAHVDEFVHGRVLDVNLHGKLSRSDFDHIVPETERLIQKYGKIRILVILHDFDGWDLGATWEEIKWEAKHFNHVDRIAIVGDERWHKRMASLCGSFTTARVHYFALDALDAAYQWVDA